MTKPTIAELEAILASAGPHNVIIAPDGSIHVGVNMGDITGIHLQGFKDTICVSLEIGGEWIEVIKSNYDGLVSRIVEPAGVQTCVDRHRAMLKCNCANEDGDEQIFGHHKNCPRYNLETMLIRLTPTEARY